MKRSLVHTLALWLLCAAALLSCKPAPSQILVRIETDIPQGAMGTLRAVRVELKHPSSADNFYVNTFALDGSTFRLPGDVAVTLSTVRLGTILDARVYAMRGVTAETDDLFRVRAVATFPREDAVTLYVYLANRCLLEENRRCPEGFTCGRYGCEPEVRGMLSSSREDAGAPDVNVVAPLMDGGMDAANDGGSDGSMDASSEASSCASPLQMCGASCVDTRTDANHCGMCGLSCAGLAHVNSATCAASACRIVMCEPGYSDCDGNARNGCETAITTQDNCGGCGTRCAGTFVCDTLASPARCVDACMGTVLCSGSCVDTQRNIDHCGACGNACPDRANATRGCSSGSCSLTCTSGFANCDGSDANGCEADTMSSASTCGGCAPCPLRANATARCTGGACGYTCNAGWADCDGNMGNGCETSVRTAANCGACGRACTVATPVCDGATMTCTSACAAPLSSCGMSCVDLSSSAQHCGMCGSACSNAPNSMPFCRSGSCANACFPGYGDCDRLASNGCEADLQSSVSNCGSCGTVCAAGANASAACSIGRCTQACNAGYLDLDGDSSNGCEAWDCPNRGVVCASPPSDPCRAYTTVCMGPGFSTCVPAGFDVPDNTGCSTAGVPSGTCRSGTCVANSMDGGMTDSGVGDAGCMSMMPCSLSNECLIGVSFCGGTCQFYSFQSSSTSCTLGDGGMGVCNGMGMCIDRSGGGRLDGGGMVTTDGSI